MGGQSARGVGPRTADGAVRELPRWLSKAEVREALAQRVATMPDAMRRALRLAEKIPASQAAHRAGVNYGTLRRKMHQLGMTPLGPQKAPSCTRCGGPNETHGSCLECERARQRSPHHRQAHYERRSTPEGKASRRRSRAAAAAKKGKVYRTQEEHLAFLHQKKAQRAERLSARPRRVRVPVEVWIRRLKVERPDKYDVTLTRRALAFRGRYWLDDRFRNYHILKATARELDREVGSDGTITPAVLLALFAEATQCPYCDSAMRSQDKCLDHVRPIKHGGKHSIANVLVCCRSCNAHKGARLVWQAPNGIKVDTRECA